MNDSSSGENQAQNHEEMTGEYTRPDISELTSRWCTTPGWIEVYCPWCGTAGCVNPDWHGAKCRQCKRAFTF
jgi:hypothetical protein